MIYFRVDIADAARKVLLQGFIDSVVSLESFSDVNRTLQVRKWRFYFFCKIKRVCDLGPPPFPIDFALPLFFLKLLIYLIFWAKKRKGYVHSDPRFLFLQ